MVAAKQNSFSSYEFNIQIEGNNIKIYNCNYTKLVFKNNKLEIYLPHKRVIEFPNAVEFNINDDTLIITNPHYTTHNNLGQFFTDRRIIRNILRQYFTDRRTTRNMIRQFFTDRITTRNTNFIYGRTMDYLLNLQRT